MKGSINPGLYFDDSHVRTRLTVTHIHVLMTYNGLQLASPSLGNAQVFPATSSNIHNEKQPFSHFLFHPRGQVCCKVFFLTCQFVYSSSLVWDNDSHRVKCTWIQSSPVIYCYWVDGYAGFNVVHCNIELWFNERYISEDIKQRLLSWFVTCAIKPW